MLMNELSPFQIVGLILGASFGLTAIWWLSKKWISGLTPMYPLPIQTLFLYCTVFTTGILVLSTRAPGAWVYGLLLCFTGLAIFLPEQKALRFAGLYLLLLVMSLLDVWGRLQMDDPFFQPKKINEWWAGGFGLIWGLGVLFIWHRWHTARTENAESLDAHTAGKDLKREAPESEIQQ